MTDAEPPNAPRQRGRPRNPELEPRVFDAALRLYGKGALLREVLERRWVSVDRIDTGSFAEDLRALCRMLFAHLAGPLGAVGLQLQLDVVRHPVVADAVHGYADDVPRSARMIVRRAVARGELAPETATTTSRQWLKAKRGNSAPVSS